MKKIIFSLLVLLPLICFGQTVVSDAQSRNIIKIRESQYLLLNDKESFDSIFSKYRPIDIDTFKVRIKDCDNSDKRFFQNQSISGLKRSIIVVDGMPVESIEDLNIDDIESIQILKEATSKMVFGNTRSVVLITTKKKVEYETIVIAPGYETFIATQKSKDFYSESYLKTKNSIMVTEWNIRHNQPLRYSPDIYEVSIDYNSSIDYGLDVEYELYMFFRFMEKQHKMSLNAGRPVAGL